VGGYSSFIRFKGHSNETTIKFGPNWEDLARSWRRLHNEELHNCTLHQILLGRSSKGGWEGQDM